ncbi:hypothetical protein NUK36_03190 [Aeromonas hydrophila]|uniref:hypothetical protein n=1 Tax=Aeromonas hydrophila TaxID=644 RepID=UPI00214DC82A|nr:hypothetical protein [Aeromonas hydrophila]MCR3901827.1 hypothetical protein [Aeromonas hydrophila]
MWGRKLKTQNICRGLNKVSQPTTDKLRLNSHSLDEFVTFMYDAFGLRDGRQHQLKELKSIDALSDMVEKMTMGLAKHLVSNNGKSTNVLMLSDQLMVMFDFMNQMLLHFNRTEIFSDLSRTQLYVHFLRDVQLPFMRQAIALITNQDEPIFYSPLDRNEFRADNLMTHLLYMLTPEYLQHVEVNVNAWMCRQKKFLSHGVGTTFKKALRGYKGKTSIISLHTIDKLCQELHEDNVSVSSKGFPSMNELQSFWYGARIAIFFSRHIDFSISPMYALEELKDNCLSLLTDLLKSNSPYLHSDTLMAFFDKASTKIAKSSLTSDELNVIFNTISDSSKYNILPPQGKIIKPIIQFCYDFNAVISFISNGEIIKSHERSLSILNSENNFSAGRFHSILIRLMLALKIKLYVSSIKHREYENIAKVAFLLGGTGFSLEKSPQDPFKEVNESVFSTPSILYAFSSIQTYTDVLECIETLSMEEKIAMMIPFPNKLERALNTLYSSYPDLQAAPLDKIRVLLTPFMKSNCIPYIPKSTLYNCLCEINSLIDFWPSWIMEQSVNVQRCSTIQSRIYLLKRKNSSFN